MTPDDIVVGLVALWGGKLLGRTRLQKGAYLLHCCGANLDLRFVYYHYGPFSFELAEGCLDARADERLRIAEHQGLRAVYGIFTTGSNSRPPDGIGDLTAARARPLVERMKQETGLVLEIAATIVFFRDRGMDMQAALAETKARKPVKASKERLDKAMRLLRDLRLCDATAAAAPEPVP